MYVGDIHGREFCLDGIEQAAIKHGCKTIVQTGDWAMYWPIKSEDGPVPDPDDPMLKYFNERAQNGIDVPECQIGHVVPEDCPQWVVCLGNHDNYDEIDRMWEEQGRPDIIQLAPGCIAPTRGHTMEIAGLKHLFCSGATSTDKYHRVPHLHWWEQEVPNSEEFQKFADGMAAKPDVVVTHEAPGRVPVYRTGRHSDVVANNFDNVLKVVGHHPHFWMFGHHHILEQWYMQTRFVCCGYHGDYCLLMEDGEVDLVCLYPDTRNL
jgi:hypothetical protein